MRPGVCLTLLLGFVVFVSHGIAQAAGEARVALVIGNGAYTTLSPLKNPANDAELMTETLKTAGFDVDLVVDGDRRTMAVAVARFQERLSAAGPQAVGLFFYAGHGVQAEGSNYLIPVGASIDSEAMLRFDALEANDILRSMGRAGNRLNMVILDACRDNPFSSGFRSVSRGLARVEAPRGSLVAYSAAPGEVAVDGSGDNSPYTAALAEAIRTPGLKAEEIFKRVRIAVGRATSARQTPWEESSLTGDFYFLPPAAPTAAVPARPAAPAPAPTVDERALELAFWQSVQDSADWRDFQAYLDRYGEDGTFSGLAAVRRDRLREAETEVAALPPASETPGAASPVPPDPGTTPVAAGPTAEEVEAGLGLSREERRLVQRGLNALEHEAGVVDGIFGSGTRGAIRSWQTAGGLAATGFLTADQAKVLLAEGRQVPVASTQTQIGSATFPGRRPGETFRDCAECPEMVVIPAGEFMIGSPVSEAGRDYDEGPQRKITVKSFAIGATEVTVGEFRAFAHATGHRTTETCLTHENGEWNERSGLNWRNPGFPQSDRHPVVCISWQDARAYVRWLSQITGNQYRLPSEAEWEYAARAGTSSPYGFGAATSQLCSHANGAARETNYYWRNGSCRDGYDLTAPVGSFTANRFGLHDMHGNVWEGVQDCWRGDYRSLPEDGSAWLSDGCSQRVLRGGSWFNDPKTLRSANRFKETTFTGGTVGGFRVAKTL